MARRFRGVRMVGMGVREWQEGDTIGASGAPRKYLSGSKCWMYSCVHLVYFSICMWYYKYICVYIYILLFKNKNWKSIWDTVICFQKENHFCTKLRQTASSVPPLKSLPLAVIFGVLIIRVSVKALHLAKSVSRIGKHNAYKDSNIWEPIEYQALGQGLEQQVRPRSAGENSLSIPFLDAPTLLFRSPQALFHTFCWAYHVPPTSSLFFCEYINFILMEPYSTGARNQLRIGFWIALEFTSLLSNMPRSQPPQCLFSYLLPKTDTLKTQLWYLQFWMVY